VYKVSSRKDALNESRKPSEATAPDGMDSHCTDTDSRWFQLSNRRAHVGLLVFATAFLIDRVTKIWAHDWLFLNGPVDIVSRFFALRYARNTGIAFGLLAKYQPLVQWLSPVVFVVLVVFFLKSVHFGVHFRYWRAICFGMVIGGALGNLYDRLRFQFVIDFLDFYLGSCHWPTFNMADTFICIGVGILVLLAYKAEKLSQEED